MTNFFLCLFLAASWFASAHTSTTTYIALPGEQTTPLYFQTLESAYIDCDSASDDTLFLRERDKNLEASPPLSCSAKTPLSPTPFYMIKMDSKPIEYSCSSTPSSWVCKNDEPNSRNILQCNIISNLNSTATIRSGETLIHCYLGSSFQISHYSSYLKVSLHSLYPLVPQYLISKNQKVPLMPNFGFASMTPTCRINNRKYQIKTREFNFFLETERQDTPIDTSKNSQNTTTTKISLELQSKLAKGIILNLDLNLEIISTEIEAFYSAGAVNVISRRISSQFSYILISENKSLTVSCLPQAHAFQVPTILRCSGFPENMVVSSQRWRLGTLDGIKVLSHSKLFEIQILPSLKSHTFLNVTSKVLDPHPALILTVDSMHLSSWLIELRGPTIIECNFFNDQSTLGLLLDTNKIACPVLEDHKKYLVYFDDNFEVAINLDLNGYLFINISQSPGTVLPLPSFRMLDMQVLYAFSILDPIIIVEPAQETYVTHVIFKY